MDVALDSLRTGNGTRDGHMRAALETDRFPSARFALDSLRPSPSPSTVPGAQAVRLFGGFTVHGVTRPVVADAMLEQEVGGAWRLSARFPITLAEHGISKGLSRMFGTLKVGPVVSVAVDLRFAPAP